MDGKGAPSSFPTQKNRSVITESPPVNSLRRVDGRFAFKVIMPNRKPDDPLEPSMRSRSLGIALGVTEFLFIAGLVLLAPGVTLVFGYGWTLIICGGILVCTAFYNAQVG